MADERLRDLERRWRETGDIQDEAAYLRERVRQGDLTHRQLFLAAYLGVPAAMEALEEGERPSRSDMERVRAQRERLFELCPDSDPRPLQGPEIAAVSGDGSEVHHRLLLMLAVVGVGDYGGGVTIVAPAPIPDRDDVRLLGQVGERQLAFDPRGKIGLLTPSGLRREDKDALEWLDRHLRAHDPAKIPWHVANVTRRGEGDSEGWSARTEAWCAEIRTDSDFSLRTHLKCPKCRFPFIYRTSFYSLSSSADVRNWGRCANPDCRHGWTEVS